MVYMSFGAQFTNHSAILGSPSDAPPFGTFSSASQVPNISRIGLIRRQPFERILDLIATRVETLDVPSDSLQDAADRLALAWMALEASPTLHALVFGPSQPAPPPHSATADEFSSIFDDSLELVPTVRQQLESISTTVEAHYDKLDYALTYAPRERLATAVQYCWSTLDELSSYYGTEIRRFITDSRYSSLVVGSRTARRAASFVTLLLQHDCYQLAYLWSCHLALSKLGVLPDLAAENERRILAALDLAAERAPLMLASFSTPCLAVSC
ncbi:hypothetical protein JCM1840_003070 [Sporobolomyces johnsonii]